MLRRYPHYFSEPSLVVEDEDGKGETRVKWDRRISGQAWLWDSSDLIARRISNRAAALTGLGLGMIPHV